MFKREHALPDTEPPASVSFPFSMEGQFGLFHCPYLSLYCPSLKERDTVDAVCCPQWFSLSLSLLVAVTTTMQFDYSVALRRDRVAQKLPDDLILGNPSLSIKAFSTPNFDYQCFRCF